MNARFTRFGSPVLGQHANNVYSEIYFKTDCIFAPEENEGRCVK